MLTRLRDALRRRALRREIRALDGEARWIERRARRLSDAQRAQLASARARIVAAQIAGQEADLAAARDEMAKLLDGPLRSARKSQARAYAESIGGAVFVALFLRCFVVEAYQIPSGSMIPTLQVGDHIFVNRFIHGLRVPFTRRKIATDLVAPKRGEIIVFQHPREPDKDLIKRIVAVGGDTIEVRDDVLWLNGRPTAHAAAGDPCSYHDYDEASDQWEVRACRRFRDGLDGTSYTTLHDPDERSPLRAFGPRTVPAGSVFVMGDNRDHSSDSRFWGFVPDELIEGRAMFVWWSYGEPEGVRYRRFLQPVR